MASYRFVMGFRQLGRTATETWYHDAADLKEAATWAHGLMSRRNAMLFTTTEWVGIRIGLANSPRAAQLYSPGKYVEATDGLAMTVPQRGVLGADANGNAVDQPNSAIQIVVRFGDSRSTKRYLAFVPDAVVSGDPGGVDLGQNGAFSAAYTAFQGYITAGGWGIQARAVTGDFAEKDIVSWTASDQAPNNMGAALVLATAPTIVVGDKVQIKAVRRKGTDKTSYNMTYRVTAVVDSTGAGTRTVYLGQSATGDPASIKVNGKLQKVGYQSYPVQKWSWFRAGTHKRGASFGKSVGRRKTRVLVDP